MLAVERSDYFRRLRLEDTLRRNTFSGSRPHVGDIEIAGAVVVVVKPADAHARTDILQAGLFRDVGKGSIAVVAIEILTAEIVDDIQVGPAVIIEIAPSTAEAVTWVITIKTSLPRYIMESS